MSACIFIGPSLPQADALAIYPQCLFLPPVQHGSIYEALQRWPLSAIGVIDGYFQHRPSVWHKEILWALDQGVYVAGAGSMGALRAAELAAFGMVGIGKVFKAFEQGAMPPFCGLNDDDEVAIMHGPAESGYVVVSEAMVNVRHTLDAARAAKIIDAHVAKVLTDEAKSLHFSDRTYKRIFDQASGQGISSDLLQPLLDWLPTGKVDQKKNDAIELVQHMATLDRSELPRAEKRFYFQTTEIFHDALHSRSLASQQDSLLLEQDRSVLDELRLNEEAYCSAKLMAIVNCLLTSRLPPLSQIEEYSTAMDIDQQSRQVMDDFRRANGLYDRETIDHWLADHDLELTELENLVLKEALINVYLMLPDIPPVSTELINHLKLSGRYPQLVSRAKRKRDSLALQPQPVSQARQLLDWYFKIRCGKCVPEDMMTYALQLGLTNEADLLELLAREYHYIHLRTG